MFRRCLTVAFACLFLTSLSLARIGDGWTTKRGDGTPNQRYDLATQTTSGRIIAINRNGAVMSSDNAGGSWEYGRIEIDGVPVRGVFSDIYQVPGGSLIIVVKRLEESEVGYFNYYIRTYLLTSNNNGNTWTETAFPVAYAEFAGSGHRYYGVDIYGLTMGPGGELLAYGTTTGTNQPGTVYWSIGGAIFRRAGATWVQAHFGNGPVAKVTDAGGRAVAVSHNAILDSADGAGWNGYVIGRANIDLDGGTMDAETRFRLRVIDVEVLGDTYIAQGATFVPYGDSGFIDTTTADRTFKMSSLAPFAGGRFWNAYAEPYRGYLTKVGPNIVAMGTGSAYVTSSSGPGFTLAEDDIHASGAAIAVMNSSTAYVVESSERVWKTTNSGGSWTKILDIEVLPNLQFLGAYNGILFARGDGDLWVSRDNGESWQKSNTAFSGFSMIVQGAAGRLISPGGGAKLQISDDGGTTWTTKTIDVPSTVSAGMVEVSNTDRLIVPSTGKSVLGEGKFFVSDDNGETWAEKNAGLGWNEFPTASVQTASGRLIVSTNTFATFNPSLIYSDDDGETWSRSNVLRSTEGLDTVSGDPSTKVISISQFRSSSTGRIVALGDDEILTSDDDGDSWTVRTNLDYETPDVFLNYELRDVIQAGSRWVAIGSYRTPYPQSRNRHFLLISDDDGATWGQRPFETNQPNTYLYDLLVDDNGRLLMTGGNGAVFVSDPDTLPPTSTPLLTVREGSTGMVPIERPDVAGAVTATYLLQQQTALAGTDFVAGGGEISWATDDTAEQLIPIETIDNTIIDGARELVFQMVFETSEDFVGTIETPVAILDDDAGTLAGIVFDSTADRYTTEEGGSVDIAFALEAKPAADVVVTVSGLDASEGTLSATEFTFTPTNWSDLQSLTVTGIDDAFPDGDATYELAFEVTTTDANYAILPATKISVTNQGDETYVVDGDTLDALFTRLARDLPIEIGPSREIAFRIPDSGFSIAISSEVSSDLVNWSPGPDPVKGATADGFIAYSLTLPSASTAFWARMHFAYVEK